uniref:Mitochondrial import inner membrane translocase subunit Tim21 n=1 Tax=Caenorhabditis japonica TaxID=281687 RepID=A0A8R1HIN6_CAEJA
MASLRKLCPLGTRQNALKSWILTPAQFRHFSRTMIALEKTPAPQPTKQEHALQKSVLEEIYVREKPKPTTFSGKVAEKASNTFMYTAVIAGVGLIGAFIYVLAGEFFAQDSPQAIFNKALDLVRNDGRCQDIFGASIAGFGEETARGRRRHVAHHKYEKDGMQRIRVLFHVKGDRGEGIAQAEMEQRDGDWQWRFLYVEDKKRPKTTHVLIDNR